MLQELLVRAVVVVANLVVQVFLLRRKQDWVQLTDQRQLEFFVFLQLIFLFASVVR